MFVQPGISELAKSCEVWLKSHWNIRDDFPACELQSMRVQHLIIWYFGIVIIKTEKNGGNNMSRSDFDVVLSGCMLLKVHPIKNEVMPLPPGLVDLRVTCLRLKEAHHLLTSTVSSNSPISPPCLFFQFVVQCMDVALLCPCNQRAKGKSFLVSSNNAYSRQRSCISGIHLLLCEERVWHPVQPNHQVVYLAPFLQVRLVPLRQSTVAEPIQTGVARTGGNFWTITSIQPWLSAQRWSTRHSKGVT